MSSVEFLTAGDDGIYSARQINSGGICSDVDDYKVETRNPVGAIFNNLIHICTGSAAPDNQNQTCFKYQQDNSWEPAFELASSLNAGSGQSVVFGESNGTTPWWIVKGLQAETGVNQHSRTTELWGNDPPSQITNPIITLPIDELNVVCVVKISDYEALIVGRPTTEDVSYSWKFNYTANSWTRVGDTNGRREFTSCAYIENAEGKYVLLVGGFDGTNFLSTTERFDLATEQWTLLQGVTLNKDIASGNMVTVNNNKEVLFIGGWDGSNFQSGIWRMDGGMNSWTFAGNLATARSNAVSLVAPPSSLPPLCAATTTPSTATTQSQTTN